MIMRSNMRKALFFSDDNFCQPKHCYYFLITLIYDKFLYKYNLCDRKNIKQTIVLSARAGSTF